MVTFHSEEDAYRIESVPWADELAMPGARESATMELAHFSRNTLILSTEGFFKDFFSTLNVYIIPV